MSLAAASLFTTGARSVREAKLHRVVGAFEDDLDPGGRVAIYRTPLPTLAVLRAPLAKIVGERFAALTRLYRDGHRGDGGEWSRGEIGCGALAQVGERMSGHAGI